MRFLLINSDIQCTGDAVIPVLNNFTSNCTVHPTLLLSVNEIKGMILKEIIIVTINANENPNIFPKETPTSG